MLTRNGSAAVFILLIAHRPDSVYYTWFNFSFTVLRFLPHHKYSRRLISRIPGFSSFLVYSNIPQTFHRQIAQTNRMFMFQHSLPARRTNNGLDNVLLQYPTAFRTFFAGELLNRQVLLGYLLLSYNDNLLRRKRKNRTLNRSKPFLPKLCSQRQLGNEAVVTLRGKNQPRTQRPRPRLISNFFFDVALLMMTSPLFLCFQCVLFYT